MSVSYEITPDLLNNFETTFNQLEQQTHLDNYIIIDEQSGKLSITQEKTAAASVLQISQLQACLNNYLCTYPNLSRSIIARLKTADHHLTNLAFRHLYRFKSLPPQEAYSSISFSEIVSLRDERYETPYEPAFECKLPLHKSEIFYDNHKRCERALLDIAVAVEVTPPIAIQEFDELLEKLQEKLKTVLSCPINGIKLEVSSEFELENFEDIKIFLSSEETKTHILNSIFYISTLMVESFEYNFACYKKVKSTGLIRDKVIKFKHATFELFENALSPRLRDKDDNLIDTSPIGHQQHPANFTGIVKDAFREILDELDQTIFDELLVIDCQNIVV